MKKNSAPRLKAVAARAAAKHSGTKRTTAAAMLESVFACKWSARILNLVRSGTHRPGALVRALDGLTTKVSNQCLRRLVQFGLLRRASYAEVPPRVEYRLTQFGERFVSIIDAVEALQQEMTLGGARRSA